MATTDQYSGSYYIFRLTEHVVFLWLCYSYVSFPPVNAHLAITSGASLLKHGSRIGQTVVCDAFVLDSSLCFTRCLGHTQRGFGIFLANLSFLTMHMC